MYKVTVQVSATMISSYRCSHLGQSVICSLVASGLGTRTESTNNMRAKLHCNTHSLDGVCVCVCVCVCVYSDVSRKYMYHITTVSRQTNYPCLQGQIYSKCCTPLTMTRLTRETALAWIPSTPMEPSMCAMILLTVSKTIMAAQRLRPRRRMLTINTAPVEEEVLLVRRRRRSGRVGRRKRGGRRRRVR